jgi:ATP/maltotriose-dependent transcriptional regulator MalT
VPKGLIGRHDLVAALDRAAGKRVTIISAPAGSGKTSLLREWAERAGQQRRIAFMSVPPGQHDAQLFWLALLGAIRAATGGAEPPPAVPGFNGQAMVDKVRSELAEASPFGLIIDDLHELSSAEAVRQLTALLTSLPPGVHAVVATRRDLPLHLHQLRLVGELAEIRAAQLRFTENETRELLAAAGLAVLDDQLAGTGEIRNAAAVIRLAEQDPAGARRELSTVLDGSAPVNPYLTLVEAHLLDALACRGLGDGRAARAAAERALHLAEPDRLILPFAMTGAWELLTALPPQGTSHTALIADILDAVRGSGPGDAAEPGPADELSPSELRVLRYLPTNLTRPEIAGQLSVSLNTVNTHIRRIYAKLGATDRSSAVQRGRDLRLLSSGRAR